jgi:hypothetical protein
VKASAPAFAASLTRAWVHLYTRGLPEAVRTGRRAEIESDLWEHDQWRTADGIGPGRVAFEIVTRLAAGMAADLAWRVERRSERRHTTDPLGGEPVFALLKKHGMVALAVALGVWSIAVAPILIGSDDRTQVIVSISFGLLLLGGLVALHRGLRGARAAIAVGAIGAGLLAIWLVLPAVAGVAILIWLYETRESRQAPPQPA